MAVRQEYNHLVEAGGNEFAVLVECGEEELAETPSPWQPEQMNLL
ncbi:MAG: hypothetical protein ACREKR_02950 [Candidatus Methylomirabilales bacterium]